MNKHSAKLDDLRARVLDTESLLFFMRDRENLQQMLDHGSPEDPIRAMLDSAYDSISHANELCQALLEARDEDFRAEYKETAIEAMNSAMQSKTASTHYDNQGSESADAVFASREQFSKLMQPVNTVGAATHLDTLDEVHEQSAAMLNMLMVNHRHASQGAESLADSALESYVWQLVSNMERAVKAASALSNSLKEGVRHE